MSAKPLVPPPPPIDCALIASDIMPAVTIVELEVTVTAPALPVFDEKPPTDMLLAAPTEVVVADVSDSVVLGPDVLEPDEPFEFDAEPRPAVIVIGVSGMVAVTVAEIRPDNVCPPPPPIDCARMPFEPGPGMFDVPPV